MRSEKLILENTGQSVCIGSPGWGVKDLEHKFGTKKCTATVAVGWGWEAAHRQAVVDLRVCVSLRVSWIAAS